jgi:4-aminobutyrate aminotransferase
MSNVAPTRPQVPVFPPGPQSIALWTRRKSLVGDANYTGLYGIALAEGSGPYLTDADGNIYLDCLSCASSTVLGYGQEFLARAYYDQAQLLQQSCFTYSINAPALDLAEKLISLAPGDWDKRAMIGLSGSDSNGGAIKAARKFTRNLGIIHFKNDYHGSTGLSQEASDFGTLNDGIYGNDPDFVEFDFPRTEADAESVLAAIFDTIISGQALTVLCEAIQGDAGCVVPPAGFMSSLRQITENNGALLIVDEVQAGMGRTGQWWSHQTENIIPDLFVVAKGLSGGYAPISAVVGRADVINSLSPGQHLFTYGGHPPSCAVAKAVLDYIDGNDLPANAARVGGYLLAKLAVVQQQYPEIILDVRGRGLMIGVQIDITSDTLAGKIFATRCVELGVYVGFFGVNGDVVRIEPPLIIDQNEADVVVATVAVVADEMRSGTIPAQTVANVKKYSIGI